MLYLVIVLVLFVRYVRANASWVSPVEGGGGESNEQLIKIGRGACSSELLKTILKSYEGPVLWA